MSEGIKRGDKSSYISLGCAMIFVTLLLIALTYICSVYFAEVMGLAKLENLHLDATQMRCGDYASLYGEWEYFYNKWIVTDNLTDAEPDGVIRVPDVWTGKTDASGERLPRTGYGSFRITATIPAGTAFQVHAVNFDGAYRTYINGRLNTVYGIMSEDVGGTASYGIETEVYPYVAEKTETVTIVVELSASREGGMHSAFSIVAGDAIGSSASYGEYFAFIVLGALIMLFIIGIFLNASKTGIGAGGWTFTAVLVTVLLMFVFSVDVYRHLLLYLKLPWYNPIAEIFYAFSVAAAVAFVYHLVRTGVITLKPLPWQIAALAIFNVGCIAAFYCLYGYKERIIPVFLQLFVLSFVYVPLMRGVVKKVKFAGAYTLFFFALMFVIGISMMDMLDFVVLGTESVASYAVMVMMMGVYALYFMRMRDYNKAAIDAADYKRRTTEIQADALRAQIKPHFMFNCLTCIQGIYRESIAAGDRAMEHFSRHLRANIDAGVKGLVRFDEEIDNTLNYVALEEMRLQKEINLMLDVDVWDLKVPVLSLQPIVENAIRHSGITEKEDGYVLISAKETPEGVEISVSDNGCGFDAIAAMENSVGLKNAVERMKLLMKARAEIITEPGEGTQVKFVVSRNAKEG